MAKEDTGERSSRDKLATPANSGCNLSGTTVGAGATASTCFPKPIRLTCRPVTVEPVIFLVMFSVALNVPLTTQYVWDQFSEDLGVNGSRGSACGNKSLEPLTTVGCRLDQNSLWC